MNSLDKELDKDQMIKIHWTAPDPVEAGIAGESLWAKYMGDGIAEVQNSPFCTDAFGLGDFVRIERQDGLLEIVKVVDQVCRTITAIWDTKSPKMPNTCAICDPEPHKKYKESIEYVDKANWEKIARHFKKYDGVRTESACMGFFSISVPIDMDEDSIFEMCDACPVSLAISLEKISSN
jgi:hypothetical protein